MTILITAYLLNLFDLAMTTYWVRLYGLSIEANPIGRWMFEHDVAWLIKIFGVGAALLALHFGIKKHPKWKWGAWLILAVYAAIAVYHVGGILCFSNCSRCLLCL